MTDTTVEAPATPRLKVKYNEQIIPGAYVSPF